MDIKKLKAELKCIKSVSEFFVFINTNNIKLKDSSRIWRKFEKEIEFDPSPESFAGNVLAESALLESQNVFDVQVDIRSYMLWGGGDNYIRATNCKIFLIGKRTESDKEYLIRLKELAKKEIHDIKERAK